LNSAEISEIFRGFLTNTTEAIFFCSREGNIVFWNKSCSHLFGYNDTEIRDISVYKLVEQKSINVFDTLLESVKSGGSLSFDVDFLSREGRVINSTVTAGKINDSPGEILYFKIREPASQTKPGEDDTELTRLVKLIELSEKRDPEGGEHSKRIRSYARIIAQELSQKPKYKDLIDLDYLKRIYDSASLYDIGKIGVPDHILHKPGKLTEEEFDIIRKHTTSGAQLLEGAKCLEMARDIACYHHEKFDGSGYPKGLRGEEIPLPARIVALADVYDAMTTNRIYKEASPHDRTCKLIAICSGGHFDPDVVDAFNAREEDFKRVREIYK
jgi:PAS domain S-box-containing protein